MTRGLISTVCATAQTPEDHAGCSGCDRCTCHHVYPDPVKMRAEMERGRAAARARRAQQELPIVQHGRPRGRFAVVR